MLFGNFLLFKSSIILLWCIFLGERDKNKNGGVLNERNQNGRKKEKIFETK